MNTAAFTQVSVEYQVPRDVHRGRYEMKFVSARRSISDTHIVMVKVA